MIAFDHEEENRHISVAKITVLGVGGAGGNTVNCMIQSDEYEGVNFVSINTDAQALKLSLAPTKIQIGQKSTKGLGAGANPDMGKKAAEEDLEKILEAVGTADIVFVTGGMGGGTGSGALPVIVEALKERNILTIVIITKPFAFEGKRRLGIAENAIEKIKKFADTLLIIPNQKLLDLVDEKVSMIDGFAMINEVLNQSVKGISDIITRAGHINVDFADVKEIMRDKGLAVMGTGRASGPDRAKKAALQAISSPILENMNIAGARGVLLNITGGINLSLHEISQAASVIYDKADEQANIIIGSVIDTTMNEEIAVTVIATGFSAQVPAPVADVVPAQAQFASAQQPVTHIQAVSQSAQAQPVYAQPIQQAAAQVQYVAQPATPAQTVIQAALVQQPVTHILAATQAAPAQQSVQHVHAVSHAIASATAEQAAHDELEKFVAEELARQAREQAAAQVIAQSVVQDVPVQLLQEEQAPQVQEVQKASESAAFLSPMNHEKSHAMNYAETLVKEKALVTPEFEEQRRIATAESRAIALATADESIDIKDLDVPTFMRKHVKEKSNNAE